MQESAVRTRSADTDTEAERVQLELLRAVSPARRLELAFSLSAALITLSRARLQREHPEETDEQIGVRFVALAYGREMAEAVRAHLAGRPR